MTLTSLFVAAPIGCNERGDGRDTHESNLRLIGVLYSQYLSAHQGEAPRSAEDFRAFVDSLGPGVLERAGLSEIDDLFVSTRDGKLLAVKYESEKWPLEGAIAYEQVGADGTRFVVADLGGVTEIPNAEFLSRLQK
jgi:hypothetical protein